MRALIKREWLSEPVVQQNVEGVLIGYNSLILIVLERIPDASAARRTYGNDLL